MFDVSFDNIDFDLLLQVFSFICLLPFQIWLCFKVKKRIIRLFPLLFFLIIGLVLFGCACLESGWDSLGYLIFSIYALYLVLTCAMGWVIWWIISRFIVKKNKEDNV